MEEEIGQGLLKTYISLSVQMQNPFHLLPPHKKPFFLLFRFRFKNIGGFVYIFLLERPREAMEGKKGQGEGFEEVYI